jgi:thioredoxin reductase (NADPH)
VGASPSRLGIPGEADFVGKGVSFCGTCDGPFYRDQEVAAIGGGNTAAEEANFLTKFASKVYLIHRRDQLRADGILAERVLANDKIEVLWSHVPLAVEGGPQGVQSLRLKDLKNDREFSLPISGAFVFVGIAPNTAFLADIIDLNDHGFINIGPEQATNLAGVFAAGDCCSKMLRQIVVAAGEGAVAAVSAQHYLEEYP